MKYVLNTFHLLKAQGDSRRKPPLLFIHNLCLLYNGNTAHDFHRTFIELIECKIKLTLHFSIQQLYDIVLILWNKVQRNRDLHYTLFHHVYIYRNDMDDWWTWQQLKVLGREFPTISLSILRYLKYPLPPKKSVWGGGGSLDGALIMPKLKYTHIYWKCGGAVVFVIAW